MLKTDSCLQIPFPAPISFEGNIYENFLYFKNQWENYSIATGLGEMPEKVKVSTLFLTIGQETFSLLHNNLNISKEDQNSTERIFNILENHFKPKVNVVWERYVFNQAIQEKYESPAQYLERLKNLATKCNYEDVEIMIRDRFVAGLQDAVLGKKLASDPLLTLEKALFTLSLSWQTVKKECRIDTVVEKHQANSNISTLENSSENSFEIANISKEPTVHPTPECSYKSAQKNETFLIPKAYIGVWPIKEIWKIKSEQGSLLQRYQICDINDGGCRFWFRCSGEYPTGNGIECSELFYPVETVSWKITTEEAGLIEFSEEFCRKMKNPIELKN